MEDLYLLLSYRGMNEAYVKGLLMSETTSLSFETAHPEIAKALIVAAAGSGTTGREAFLWSGREVIDCLPTEGMETVAHDYDRGATRLRFLFKDLKGSERFHEMIVTENSSLVHVALLFCLELDTGSRSEN